MFQGMLNVYKLVIRHFKATSKTIFVSSLSLVMGLALISASNAFIDVNIAQLFNQELASFDTSSVDYVTGLSLKGPSATPLSVKEVTSLITQGKVETGLDTFVTSEIITYTMSYVYSEVQTDLGLVNTGFIVVELDDVILQNWQAYTSTNLNSLYLLLKDDMDVVVVDNDFETNVSLNKPLRLTTRYSNTGTASVVVRDNIPNLGIQFSHESSSLIGNKENSLPFLLVRNITHLKQVLEPSTVDNFGLNVHLSHEINFNYSLVSYKTAPAFKDSINRFSAFIQSELTDLMSSYPSTSEDRNRIVNYYLTDYLFEEMMDRTQDLREDMLFYTVPVLFLSLYFFYFGYHLFYKPISQVEYVYRTKGAGIKYILGLKILSYLIMGGISVLVGHVVGTGTVVMLSLLSIPDFQTGSVWINLEIDHVGSMALGGIVAFTLMLGLGAKAYFKTKSETLADLESTTETEDPFWYRHYTDVTLFVLGAFGVMAGFFFQNLFPTMFYYPLALVLIIGLTLMSSRGFVLMTRYLRNRWVGLRGGLCRLSFVNLYGRVRTYVRTILLLSFLTSLLLAFTIFPTSYNQWSEETTRLSYGADALISFNRGYGETDYNQTLQNLVLDKLGGLKISSSPFVEASFDDSKGFTGMFLFIEPSTHFQVVYNHLINTEVEGNELIAHLEENNRSDAIVLQKDLFDLNDLSVGETWQLGSEDFQVVGTYKYWPFISGTFGTGTIKQGLMPFSYLEKRNYSLSDTPFSLLMSGLFIKADQMNSTVTDALLNLEESLPVEVLLTQRTIEDQKHEVGEVLLARYWDLVLFILTLFYCLTCGIQVVQRILEYKHEGILLRMIGMSRTQHFLLIIMENLVILLSSLLIGSVLTGVYWWFIAAIAFGGEFYPLQLIIPHIELLFLFTGLVGLLLLQSFFSMRLHETGWTELEHHIGR